MRELANRFVFDFEAAIRDTPGTLAARRMVAATGRQYLATLVGDGGGDPALTRELAEAYYRLSQVEFSAEEGGRSTEHLNKSLDLLRGQRAGCCREAQEQFLLIRALSDLGRNLENAGNFRESLASSTEAVTRARAWLDVRVPGTACQTRPGHRPARPGQRASRDGSIARLPAGG